MDMFSFFSAQGSVAAVDPADLRSVWEMQRDLQRHSQDQASNQASAISIGLYQQVCSSGADVQSIWYRSAMLNLLAGPIGPLTPWLHDGHLPDAVFNLAAIFPMNKLSVGEVHKSPAFDIQEFIRQLEQSGKPGI